MKTEDAPAERLGARRLAIALAGAAAVVAAAVLMGPWGGRRAPARAPGGDADRLRIADARGGPAFRRAEMESSLYEDAAEYLAARGADVSFAGLVDLLRRLAAGEASPIEEAKSAAIDALRDRSGAAFVPVAIHLHDADPDPRARAQILALLAGAGDRVAVPWLDARLAAAPAEFLLPLAQARVALEHPDAGVAAGLLARAEGLGLLDAGILAAAYDLLGAAPEPGAFVRARGEAADRALARGDARWDDTVLLEVLARTRDGRFRALADRLLSAPYVPLAVEAARVAGAWRMNEAAPALRAALARAEGMGEDGEDLVPPALWALGRLGEADAAGRLLDLLRKTGWYRAGEWAVDALVDLGAPTGEIVLALPDQVFAVGKLPALLARVTMADDPAVKGKIASLPDGLLRRALVLARGLGAGPEVRAFLATAVARGGNLGLYLTFGDPAVVRSVLGSGAGDHDRSLAVHAIPMLPIPVGEKVALARGALSGAGGAARKAARAVLTALGEPDPASAPPGPEAVPEGDPLRPVLAREALYRSDPARLAAESKGADDLLAAGYRLAMTKVPRFVRRAAEEAMFRFRELR